MLGSHQTDIPSADWKKRILVVEDEIALLFACKSMFGSEGFAVHVGTSFIEAVEKLETYRYLAIIADIRLKGIDNRDGLYLLKLAKAMQPEAQVIIMTGYGSETTKKESIEYGASFYFEKPVEPLIILAALKGIQQTAEGHL